MIHVLDTFIRHIHPPTSMLEVYVLHGGRLYTLMTHLASGFSSSRIELSLATPAK